MPPKMHDLFASTSAKPAQTGAALVGGPIGKPAHRRTGAISAPHAHTGASGYLGPQGRADHKRDHLDKETVRKRLLEERNRLQLELVEVNTELEQAEVAEDPFRHAFERAHIALLHLNRTGMSKREILTYYDTRMHAGHAWHPYRERRKNADSVRHAILDRLTQINQQLDKRPPY